MMHEGTNKRIVGGLPAVVLAACGGLIQGFDTGGISNASPSIIGQFHLPVAAQGLVTSLVLVGAIVGSMSGGAAGDRFGRRGGLVLCGAVFSVGVVMEMASAGLYWLLISRFVVGLAIGAASIVSTLYIAEVSPPDSRGRNLSFFQLAVVFGIVCGILAAMAVGARGGSWRWIMGAGLLPGLVLFFGMLAMPESPSWLESRSSPPDGQPHSGFRTPAVQLALAVGVGMAVAGHLKMHHLGSLQTAPLWTRFF